MATSANFTSFRNATTATNTAAFTGDNGQPVAGTLRTSIAINGVTTNQYLMYGGHIMRFDSSGITGAVSSATFKARGGYNSQNYGISDVSVILLKTDGNMDGSTESFNALSNYLDLDGHTSGWGASDVTEYSGEVVINTAVSSGGLMSTAVVTDFTLNSDARSDLQNDNFFNMMHVEYDEVYLNSFNASPGNSGNRVYRINGANSTTTSFRYYIEYEAESGDTPSGYTHKVLGVAAGSIGKVKGVATANIGKVIGVD